MTARVASMGASMCTMALMMRLANRVVFLAGDVGVNLVKRFVQAPRVIDRNVFIGPYRPHGAAADGAPNAGPKVRAGDTDGCRQIRAGPARSHRRKRRQKQCTPELNFIPRIEKRGLPGTE